MSMRKIITTVSLLCCAFIGFSQSIVLLDTNNNVVSNSIIDVYVAPGSSTITELLIHNSTNQTRTYKCRRAILSMAADDSTQFCFGGLCYGFSANVGSQLLTVIGQDTVDFVHNGFHCDFVAGTTNSVRMVYYRFEDPSNLGDSTNVIIRYTTQVGINELSSPSGSVSNASPNPASSLFSINYSVSDFSQKTKLVIYNVLGKEVKQIVLKDKIGTAKINADEIPSGIYFYSLLADDKVISTKKLVISH